MSSIKKNKNKKIKKSKGGDKKLDEDERGVSGGEKESRKQDREEAHKKGDVERTDKRGSVILLRLKDRGAPLLLLLPVCRYE